MKTVAGILLLSLVLTIPGSYYYFFSWQQKSIRNEIKMKLKTNVPDKDLIIIRSEELINDPYLRWTGKNEFCYLGKMYDVVRAEKHEKSSLYYCLTDEKETMLLAHLDKLVKKEKKTREEKQQKNEKLQRSLICLYLNRNEPPINHLLKSDFQRSVYQFRLKTWSSIPASPPPKV